MSAPAPPLPQDPYAGAPPEYLAWFSAFFRYDRLHIRQKLLTLSEKYQLDNPDGSPRFYVVRPPKLALNAVLGVAALAVNLLIFYLAFKLFTAQQAVPAFAILFGGGFLLQLAVALLSPYRDIHVYSSEAEDHELLRISQDNKLAIESRYTVRDPFGVEVAVLKRHNIRAILRRQWLAETPGGEPICTVREDKLALALLRRYFGTLYGLLRTNFIFEFPDGSPAGRYDRQLTLTDQYIIDLSGDPWRLIDRRVTLAMAVLLDTGERR
ncbi:MAG: hypothetical protein SF028_12960 [Candidatus Sumerlaeia bacterium]|nr:hypothetical protein [Candidatus Sumerlaeia bacterium]